MERPYEEQIFASGFAFMAQTVFLGKWFHRWLQPWRGIDWLLLLFPVAITLFSSLLIASTRLYTGKAGLAWNHRSEERRVGEEGRSRGAPYP